MKRFPLHIILFSLFPLLSLYDHNKYLLELSFLVRPITFTLLFGIAICATSYIFFKNILKSGIFTTTTLLLFFSFGHILKHAYAPLLISPGRYDIVGKICYIFLVIAIFIAFFVFKLLLRTKKDLSFLNQYLNIVSSFIIVFLVFSIFAYEIKTTENEQQNHFEISSSQHKPDVYYIILDGYGREDILRDVYDFDNNTFTEELRKRGFYVADKSTSNYPTTYLSLSSSLNFSYHNRDSLLGIETKTISPKEMIKNNQLLSSFKSQGYTTISTPTPWAGIQGNIKSDVYFEGMILNDFERILLTLTPLQFYVNDNILADEHRLTVLSGYRALDAIPKINKPTFTISHIYSPHPPFVFDEHGEGVISVAGFSRLDGDSFFEGNPRKPTTEDYKNEYIPQLKYASEKILQSIDRIINDSSTPPVIILQSDHGPGSSLFFGNLEKTNLPERMSILNAYYLPEKGRDMLYESITPVNSFRVVLNSLFDADLELLDDRSYFLGRSKPYDFIDVTKNVQKK